MVALRADSQAKILDGKTDEGISELLDGVVLGAHIMRSCELLPACQGSAASAISSSRLLKLVADGKVRSQDFRMMAKQLESADSSIPSNSELAQGMYIDMRRSLIRGIWDNSSWREPIPVLHKPTGKSKEYDIPESDPTTTWWQDAETRAEDFLSNVTDEVYITAPGTRTAIVRRFDSIWKTTIEAMKKPYAEAILFEPSKSIPSHDYVNHELCIDTKHLLHITESRAVIEGLMLTCAVNAFKADHRGYPDTLQDLVRSGYLKKIPNDPYSDGKPFIYLKTADSYKLYSVGPNGKDDGGTMTDKLSHFSWNSKEDFVFSH